MAFGFDSEGRTILVSTGLDSTLRVWDPDNGDISTTLCRRSVTYQLASHGDHFALADAEDLSVISFG